MYVQKFIMRNTQKMNKLQYENTKSRISKTGVLFNSISYMHIYIYIYNTLIFLKQFQTQTVISSRLSTLC